MFSGMCKLILLLRQTLFLSVPRMTTVWPKEWAGSATVDVCMILGHNQPGLSEPSVRPGSEECGNSVCGVTVGFSYYLGTTLVMSLRTETAHCNLTYFALPVLLTVSLEHFTAAGKGTPPSVHSLLRCVSTKNPVPLAPGSRSVVLNFECTLEYPEGLLETPMAGPIPGESDVIGLSGTLSLVFFNSPLSDPNEQPELGTAALDGCFILHNPSTGVSMASGAV